MLRAVLRTLWQAFAISTIITVVNAPLVLAWQTVASPSGVHRPPLILLTSIALVAGFLVQIVSPLGTWLAWPFAAHGVEPRRANGCSPRRTASPAGTCTRQRRRSGGWSASICFRRRGNPRRQMGEAFAAAILVWVVFGLVVGLPPRTSDEARVTFLAVGHGGCVVIETPDGRVLLYDTGTTAGPDAHARVVAPYLWSRGISRIDEVFLSHAD